MIIRRPIPACLPSQGAIVIHASGQNLLIMRESDTVHTANCYLHNTDCLGVKKIIETRAPGESFSAAETKLTKVAGSTDIDIELL